MCVQRNVVPNDRSPPSSGKAPPPPFITPPCAKQQQRVCVCDPFVSWIDNKPHIRKSHFRYTYARMLQLPGCISFPQICKHLLHAVTSRCSASKWDQLCHLCVCPKHKDCYIVGLRDIVQTRGMMNVGKDVTYTTLS